MPQPCIIIDCTKIAKKFKIIQESTNALQQFSGGW